MAAKRSATSYALTVVLVTAVVVIGTLVWMLFAAKRCSFDAFDAFAPPNTHKEHAQAKLAELQASMTLEGGSFQDELPEQMMAVMFLEPTDRVLEIGGNIGRNSCIIASIVKPGNLLVLESDPASAATLARNMIQNNLNFGIEPVALSKVRLMQKGWDTLPVNEVMSVEKGEWTEVATKTWDEIKAMYGRFDTLVLDCEGAIKQILVDEPELLVGINKVIIENDFKDIRDKLFVDDMLRRNGLEIVYSEAGGWGPCMDFFFEVWMTPKKSTHMQSAGAT